jgi:N-acetylglucosaminyl-diphospho-decaprenol L-rhamnosyltransferase
VRHGWPTGRTKHRLEPSHDKGVSVSTEQFSTWGPAPSVSLITVTYNSASQLQSAWSEFRPQWAEWVVVDNASQDSSIDVALSLGARVIKLAQNKGFSVANNVGAAEARGDVIIFCNPDLAVTPEGIEQLRISTIAHGGLVAPQLMNADGTPQENGRGMPYPHRKFGHMFFGRDNSPYTRIAPENQSIRVAWVMGAAIAMTRETYASIGGWNEDFFIYYEDADICLRAAESGHPITVDGTVRWRHGWARETSGKFSIAAWRHEFRSAAKFYRLHPQSLLPITRRARTQDVQGLAAQVHA